MTLTTTAPLPTVLPLCSSSSGDCLLKWNVFYFEFPDNSPSWSTVQSTWFVFWCALKIGFVQQNYEEFFSQQNQKQSFFQQNYEERLEKRLQNTESSTVDKLQRGRRWKPTMPNYFSFKILKAFNISLIFKPSTGLLCCGINGPPDWVEVALNCHPNIIHNPYKFLFHILCAVQEPDWSAQSISFISTPFDA